MFLMNRKRIIFLAVLIFLLSVLISTSIAQEGDTLIVPDPASLELWYPMEEINAAFMEANPGVTLEYGAALSASQDEIRFLAEAAAGNLDDVIGGGDENPLMYGPRGIYTDLTPYMEQDADLWFNDEIFQTNVLYDSVEGQIFGIPVGGNPIVVLFNVQVFEDAGVPLPPMLYSDPDYQEEWSWDGFLKTAQALTQDTDGDGETDIWGVGIENNWQVWVPMIYQNGGRLTNEDESDFLIDDPAVVEALRFYTDLVVTEKVAPLPSAVDTLGGNETLLREGKIGMWVVGGWMRQAYLDDVEAGNLRIGIAPLPYKEEPATLFLGMRVSVSSRAENPELAYEYIKALFADGPLLEGFLRDQGNLPWMLNPARTDYYATVVDEGESAYTCYGSIDCFDITQVGRDAAKYFISEPPYGAWFPEVRDIVKGNFDLVFNGEMTLDEAIEAINEEADAVMQVYLP